MSPYWKISVMECLANYASDEENDAESLDKTGDSGMMEPTRTSGLEGDNYDAVLMDMSENPLNGSKAPSAQAGSQGQAGRAIPYSTTMLLDSNSNSGCNPTRNDADKPDAVRDSPHLSLQQASPHSSKSGSQRCSSASSTSSSSSSDGEERISQKVIAENRLEVENIEVETKEKEKDHSVERQSSDKDQQPKIDPEQKRESNRGRDRDRHHKDRSKEHRKDERCRSRSRERKERRRSRDRERDDKRRDRDERRRSREKRSRSREHRRSKDTDRGRDDRKRRHSRSRSGDRHRHGSRTDRRSKDRKVTPTAASSSGAGTSKSRSRSRSRSQSVDQEKDRSRASDSRRVYMDKKIDRKINVLERMGIELKAEPKSNMCVTPQMLVQRTMEQQAAQVKQATGIELPSYYNAAAVNPHRLVDQIQKRKLLWGARKEDQTTTSAQPVASNKWQGATFAQDQDGKLTAKFNRLMGIKQAAPVASAPNPEVKGSEIIKKQEEMFHNMESQYEVARLATHTHRGLGLGFGTFQPR